MLHSMIVPRGIAEGRTYQRIIYAANGNIVFRRKTDRLVFVPFDLDL